jgi:hypothetical protein
MAETTYFHPLNLLKSVRGFIPANELEKVFMRDWLGSAVFVMGHLLAHNSQWIAYGDFITKYAAKCAGRNLSPWSTDCTHYSNPFIPAKKFKLFIITEMPYTGETCLQEVRAALFHSHPGIKDILIGENQYSVRIIFDNGLGETTVTVRFIASTSPVFDIDLLGLSSSGFDIFRYHDNIQLLLNKRLSIQSCLFYKPIIIERLIENICTDIANIIAIPLSGEENKRQRRWISRQLLNNERTLLNAPYWEVDFSVEDTCTICHELFSDSTPAFQLCSFQCKYKVHSECILKYIESRLVDYTYVTCLTCREQLPLWKTIIMKNNDYTWDRCCTESSFTSESAEEICNLDSDEDFPLPFPPVDYRSDTPDSLPPLESDSD